MPFTAAELEEMRLADEEIERDFALTPEDLALSRARDREAVLETLPNDKRKIADNHRAYREANRAKIADYQRAYREARRDGKENRR